MYHAVNAAVIESMTTGVASSCSLMVPCPWARHAMYLLSQHPELPFGIHLTLFCDTIHYGWEPLTPKEQVPSLPTERGEMFTPEPVSGGAAIMAHELKCVRCSVRVHVPPCQAWIPAVAGSQVSGYAIV